MTEFNKNIFDTEQPARSCEPACRRAASGLLRCVLFWLVFSGLVVPESGLCQNKNRIEYDVFFEGVENRDLAKIVREVSETVARKDQPPLSKGLLRRRVKDDIPTIRRALRSRGFYGAAIDTVLDTDIQPARVVFRINTGPVYRLKKLETTFTIPDQEEKPALPGLDKLGIEPGQPAEAEPILKVRAKILWNLKNQGYPLADVKTPEVIVDHQDQTLSVTYSIDPGPPALFGSTHIEGAASTKTDFILKHLCWEPGDIFKADLLQKARTNLMETGLFNGVRFVPGEKLDSQGRLPLTLQVSERRQRTLKLGLGYTTDEAAKARASWQNRNLLRAGESLRLSAEGSGITRAFSGTFEKPFFLKSDQSLILDLRLAEAFPDAFTSQNLTGLAQVKRQLGDAMDVAIGVGLTFSDIEQFDDSEAFELIFLPLTFTRDRRDDVLDPTRGGHFSAKAAPYYDYSKAETSFIKALAEYSRYFKLSTLPRIVFAAKAGLGLLNGGGLREIPADLRFYAGGGGSIRGYSFQSVGPMAGGKPVGGRSLLTFSSEFRMKITQKMGIVSFLDGGNAFRSEYPDFEENLLWGAGIGLRYFTPLAPLRLDAAFPLNRREIDDAFQIYISIGQAF